VILMI